MEEDLVIIYQRLKLDTKRDGALFISVIKLLIETDPV